MRRPKTPWYTTARRSQEAWKRRSTTLPAAAQVPGHTWVEERGRPKKVGPFPICLPLTHADHNLFASVRDQAIEGFARHEIAWHHGGQAPDGTPWPSTHLLDSQVQCVNTLLTLAADPGALLERLRPLVPDARRLCEVEDGLPVAFEWSPQEDLLGELRGRPLQRGRYCTAVDALLVVEREDGGRTALLVEWKFTESYHRPLRFKGRGGTDRREVYRAAYEGTNSPFPEKPSIDDFFHEPHYQLLRQSLLAEAVLREGVFGADRAVVVHAIPRGNRSLLSTLTPGLSRHGGTVPEVWSTLLSGESVRYHWLDTLPLLQATPELAERYGDLCGVTP